jgi:hypothetical protein
VAGESAGYGSGDEMVRTEIKNTELGRVKITVITCDTCQKQAIDHPDNVSNWFDLNVFYGNLDLTGDFCSVECLTAYVTEVLPGKIKPRLKLIDESERINR